MFSCIICMLSHYKINLLTLTMNTRVSLIMDFKLIGNGDPIMIFLIVIVPWMINAFD